MPGPGGRPTKYRKEFCEQIPKLMAEGMAKVEVCAELGIGYDAFLAWQKKYPRFSESVKEGERLSEAWWMKKGRENLENREFQYVGWFMNMKNRHGWSDKRETKNQTDLTGNVTFNIIDSYPEDDDE